MIPLMPKILEVILKELERQGVSRNKLSQMLAGKVTRSHLYAYLDGKSDMGTKGIDPILEALKIDVRGTAKKGGTT